MFSRGVREPGQFSCKTSGRDFLASAGILTRPEWREITAALAFGRFPDPPNRRAKLCAGLGRSGAMRNAG